MDRRTVYPGEVVRDIDALQAQKNSLYGISYLTQSIYGLNQWIVGMKGVPSNPQGQSVLIQTGQIYQVDEVDSSAWGSLGADTTLVVQQGLLKNSITYNI